ncbi:hypothetical protein [Staphylococcus durrellii]|uniref:hypothetical protein n=1 Tax=Staphylococcus durrellii TaxID=2781773 RepID=UPI00189F10EB|nr:hypothetical protein [Staphylococcus durrellii]MBF7016896.1 hypothetical protein [Staphylococcus durrellii]
MSDIIPFPRSRDKLIRDIKIAFNKNYLDEVYELFDIFEQQFEMDETLSLLKCATLHELGYYLELREETIILLKQGFNNYDELVLFYVKSLNNLKQYIEVVEVINQIIDEVQNHQTRMELYPIKEYALSQLEQYNKVAGEKLQQFDELSLREQINTILSLIDNNQYNYKESVVNLINNLNLQPNVVSIMLEYLRFAQYDSNIQISKFGYDINVIPSNLVGLEHTQLKQQIIPNVIQLMEEDATQLINEAAHVMNNHAILLYPLDIHDIASSEEWVMTYEHYFKSMLGIAQGQEHNEIKNLILKMDNLT